MGYGVEDGPAELHLLVRALAPFLASSWVFYQASFPLHHHICLSRLESTI